ncbi:hypothetical protein SDC9_197090 [bioreactor metagenome]|uniref:Uncharacterized protein n=1 Tax=bioreactor metagenome TaxID=1076179 RepID=A0A645IG67_9ZZZZ
MQNAKSEVDSAIHDADEDVKKEDVLDSVKESFDHVAESAKEAAEDAAAAVKHGIENAKKHL